VPAGVADAEVEVFAATEEEGEFAPAEEGDECA
jgi:hypothetical protein